MKLRQSEHGQILILAALGMVVLLGTAALAIDASFMYDKRNHMHAATDAAALSAAYEWHRSTGTPNLQTFANHQLAIQGIDPATATTLTVNAPPASGPFAGRPYYVEVILGEQTHTFFGTILGRLYLTPTVRSVAGTGSSLLCVITCPLGNCGGPGSTPPGVAVGKTGTGGGGSSITATCGMSTGGDLDLGNNGTVASTPVNMSASECLGRGTCPANASFNDPPPNDPLSTLAAPPNPGSCMSPSVGSSTTLTLMPGCYSSITVGNNSTLVLSGPGTYYITGPVTLGNAANICLNAGCTFDYSSGILIYLTGMGQFLVGQGANATLNAQTSGTYDGILLFQDPSDTLDETFYNGNSIFNLSGAVYVPNANLTLGNGGSTNDCTLIIAKTLTIANGGNTFSNSCGEYGASPIMTISLAE